LLPWRAADSTRTPGTSRASARSGVTGRGKDSCWRVIAWRSFNPAEPTSAGFTPSACAIRRTASNVVRSRFSMVTNTCSPAPLGP
jgi:hypothetical protein